MARRWRIRYLVHIELPGPVAAEYAGSFDHGKFAFRPDGLWFFDLLVLRRVCSEYIVLRLVPGPLRSESRNERGRKLVVACRRGYGFDAELHWARGVPDRAGNWRIGRRSGVRKGEWSVSQAG